MEKTIIAIDPGNIESAYVVMQDFKIISFGKIANALFLPKMQEVIQKYENIDCYIEMVASYGMSVGQTVFDTCVWIGRFYESWSWMSGEQPKLIYRKDIKMHHCNATFAKDSNIITALKDKYGEKGTKANKGFFFGVSKDVWQAIALATFILETDKNL